MFQITEQDLAAIESLPPIELFLGDDHAGQKMVDAVKRIRKIAVDVRANERNTNEIGIAFRT